MPGTELYENVLNNQLYRDKLEFKPNEITTEEFDPKWIDENFTRFQRELYKIRIKKSLTSPKEFINSIKIANYKLKEKRVSFINRNFA